MLEFVFGFCTGIIGTYMAVYKPQRLVRCGTQTDDFPEWRESSRPIKIKY
jgi:hypothetical protein